MYSQRTEDHVDGLLCLSCCGDDEALVAFQNIQPALDVGSDVAVYVKLPEGFYISGPVGHFKPDWIIAFYEGNIKHNYFVAETKGSTNYM